MQISEVIFRIRPEGHVLSDMEGNPLDMADLDLRGSFPREAKDAQRSLRRLIEMQGSGATEAEIARRRHLLADHSWGIACDIVDCRPDLSLWHEDGWARAEDMAASRRKVTQSEAKDFLESLDWPGGMYFCAHCSHCQNPFQGDKRETTCRRCDRTWLKPHRVHVFEAYPEGIPAEDLSMLIEAAGLPVLERHYFAGTAMIAGLALGEISEADLEMLVRLAREAGTEVIRRDFREMQEDMAAGHQHQIKTACAEVLESMQVGKRIGRGLRQLKEVPENRLVLLRMSSSADVPRDVRGQVAVAQYTGARWQISVIDGIVPEAWIEGWAEISEGVDI